MGVVGWIGNETGFGSKGGEFNNPHDIGVNSSGAGASPGDIYVVDERNNRIERFDSAGKFVSAWGANVVTPSVTEVQVITVDATGGTFKLKFEGEETAPISESATAGQVQTALLTGILKLGGNEFPRSILISGATGGPWTVTFKSQEGASFAGTNVEQIQGDPTGLYGGGATIEVTTQTQGSGEFQICTVAASCLSGTETGAANEGDNAKNGSLGHPQSIAVDDYTGNVYVSDRDGRRISEYDGEGTFIRSFGWGVDASEPGEEYEICEGADRCRQGANNGAGVGQIGRYTGSEVLGIAVSQPNGEGEVGTVFLADSVNNRVNSYKLDGTEPSSFGPRPSSPASSRPGSPSIPAASSTPPTPSKPESSALTRRQPNSCRRSSPRAGYERAADGPVHRICHRRQIHADLPQLRNDRGNRMALEQLPKPQ